VQQGGVDLLYNRFGVPINFFLSGPSLRLVFKSAVTLDSCGNGIVERGMGLCRLRIVKPWEHRRRITC